MDLVEQRKEEIAKEAEAPGNGQSCLLPPLKSIWHEHIVKCPNNTWQCMWCKSSYNGINASCALAHVVSVEHARECAVSFCNGSIPSEHKARYIALQAEKDKKKQLKKRVQERQLVAVDKHVSTVAESMRKTPLHEIEANSKNDDSTPSTVSCTTMDKTAHQQ